MPVFEYKCSNCETKFEVLHKTHNEENRVHCPSCNSTENKKLISAFSHSFSGSVNKNASCSDGSCSTGNSDVPGGCASGFCGLN